MKQDENEEYSGEISIESGTNYASCEYFLVSQANPTKTLTGIFEGEFTKLAQILAQLHLRINTFGESNKSK